jgi:hypothetical protein
VVKALDLSSNGRMSAWVRTPLLVVNLSLEILEIVSSGRFVLGEDFFNNPFRNFLTKTVLWCNG